MPVVLEPFHTIIGRQCLSIIILVGKFLYKLNFNFADIFNHVKVVWTWHRLLIMMTQNGQVSDQTQQRLPLITFTLSYLL